VKGLVERLAASSELAGERHLLRPGLDELLEFLDATRRERTPAAPVDAFPLR